MISYGTRNGSPASPGQNTVSSNRHQHEYAKLQTFVIPQNIYEKRRKDRCVSRRSQTTAEIFSQEDDSRTGSYRSNGSVPKSLDKRAKDLKELEEFG